METKLGKSIQLQEVSNKIEQRSHLTFKIHRHSEIYSDGLTIGNWMGYLIQQSVDNVYLTV